jgi:hypothetical protein
VAVIPAVAPGLSPPPPSAAERWRRVPLGWKIVILVLAAVVAAELASSTVSGLAGHGSGASGPSSSYDSGSTGTEGFAQLLSERGQRVDRLTSSLGASPLPADSTVFVLDPTSWSEADTNALEAALSHGDRVVLGGRLPASGVLRALLGVTAAPMWQPAVAGATHPVVDLPEVRGVQAVLATGVGTYVVAPGGPGEPAPLLRGPGGVLALVAEGRGTLVLLASSSPLQNGSLGQADDAAFALDLVAPGSTTVFDEYDHGFGRAGRGLAGLPASWRWGLGLVVLAVVVWVLSAARRFGPAEAPERITVPARVRYVDAMATLLATRPPEQVAVAVAPVRDEARRRLRRRLGLPPDVPDEAVMARLAATADVGTVPPGLAAVVLAPVRTSEDVLAVGRALSELDREDHYR